MLTTKQLVEQTGVSEVTINRFVKRGHISAPRIHTDAAGRGRRAYWHPAVVDTIKILRVVSGRGVPAELVRARMEKESLANSSISSDRVMQIAERWRQPYTGGELATTLELPKESSRADVFAYGVVEIAKSLQLNDTSLQVIRSAAYNGVVTAIHNFIHAIPSVIVFSGQRARVVARFALDCYQRHDWDALGGLLPDTFTMRPINGPPVKVSWIHSAPGVTDDGWMGAAMVSVEITALLRDLWEWYDEGETPEFTLTRGYAIREHTAEGTVEYDYLPVQSGFGDNGSTISIDTTTARHGGHGRQETWQRHAGEFEYPRGSGGPASVPRAPFADAGEVDSAEANLDRDPLAPERDSKATKVRRVARKKSRG